MTITATERGRNLILIDGADDPDTAVEITVRPINVKLGAALFALYMGIAFGQSEHPEVDATNMGKLAVGEENWPIFEGDTDVVLRSSVAEQMIHAATFWNIQGGGIDLVQTMLDSSGGAPKARQLLMERTGFGEAFSALTTLLSSASASQTPSPAATPATSTRKSSGTASRLPVEKRSIRQNTP